MKKAMTLCLSLIIAFYAGQSFAATTKPCPKNKALHANTKRTKVTAQARAIAALNPGKIKDIKDKGDSPRQGRQVR